MFVPYGLYVEPRIRAITIPALVFVLLYSVLPHKELRFIVYVFPLLNIASACACQRLWINRTKSVFQTLLSLIAGGHLIGNFVLTVFLLTVSGTNYPGGVAMSRLHRIASPDMIVSVHIDNLAAQSGVTRFTEIYSNWTYNKDEHLKAGDEELHKFDFLLTEVKNKYSPEMRFLQQTHEKIELIECFSNIGVHYTSLLPIKIRTKPCIMILKKKPNAVLLKRFFDAEEPEEGEEEKDFEESETTAEINDPEISDEEEEVQKEIKEPPKLIRKKLIGSRRFTMNPKLKIKEIIEAEKLEALNILQNQQETDQEEKNNLQDDPVPLSEYETSLLDSNELSEPDAVKESDSGIKNNIKRIISQEKTKELLDELDLSAFCDLSQIDTKECLKKILDQMDE